MDITCSQMDVLISFYIDNELSSSLKDKVEQHLQECEMCREKYNIIHSLFTDLKKSFESQDYKTCITASDNYRKFKRNLSAYVDNELEPEENVKIKKYTINNKKARKDLEETYKIRRLMSESFQKTKSRPINDFSKKILKQLDLNSKNALEFNPLIKVGFAFVLTVISLTIIIVLALSV